MRILKRLWFKLRYRKPYSRLEVLNQKTKTEQCIAFNDTQRYPYYCQCSCEVCPAALGSFELYNANPYHKNTEELSKDLE